MRRARGFSLLELMIAVALLALLAAMSYRGLSSIVGSQAAVQAETRRWSDLAAVMAQLGQDLSLALARPESTAPGELVITRRGDADAGAAHSGPRRVGYRLRDGALEYVVWPSAPARAAEPVASAVLDRVAGFELRALAADGGWTPLRAAPGQAAVLPRAVEVQIVLAGGERIARLFVLQ